MKGEVFKNNTNDLKKKETHHWKTAQTLLTCFCKRFGEANNDCHGEGGSSIQRVQYLLVKRRVIIKEKIYLWGERISFFFFTFLCPQKLKRNERTLCAVDSHISNDPHTFIFVWTVATCHVENCNPSKTQR